MSDEEELLQTFDWNGEWLTYKVKLSRELIQDLKAIQGMDAEEELRKILVYEFENGLYEWVKDQWKARGGDK